MKEIVAAFATAPGAAGLAVLRIAGEGSAALADRIFNFGPLPQAEAVKRSNRTVEGLDGYQAAFGYVHQPDRPDLPVDQCVLTRFRKPHSYTGEEQVEISIHGGPALRRAVTELVWSAGARPAEAGEFSKWAFLNGKMDLSQAEAVMDLIQADTSRQQDAALKQMQGVTGQYLAEVRDRIYALLSALEVDIEYPEYEDFKHLAVTNAADLAEIRQALARLAERNRQGQILKRGLQVVLLGEPNVGKSSILNVLAGEDRAIVTEIAGTTRDVIQLELDLEGLPLQLYDTAGIRESQDVVEQLGVDRSLKLRAEADLLLLVVTAESPADIPQQVRTLVGESPKPFILLCNKADLAPHIEDTPEWQQLEQHLAETYTGYLETILMSATALKGVDQIKESLLHFYENLSGSGAVDFVLTSQRQQRLLEQALELFTDLARDHESLPADILAAGLRQGAELIGEITGEDVSEQMVEEIFARFCIGK